MGTTLTQVLGTPFLIGPRDAQFQLAPFSLEDQGKLDRFVERYPVERAKRLERDLKEAGAPPETIAALWRDAIDPERASALIAAAMTSAECLAYQVKLSLQHHHPDITEAQVSALVSLDRREETEHLLNVVNGVTDMQGNPCLPWWKVKAPAPLSSTGETSSEL